MLSEAKASLVWGSLRNNIDFSTIEIPSSIRLVDTLMGEFPVDSFHPLFLEVPRDLVKIDFSGRHNVNLSSTRDLYPKVVWNPRRVISLPIYDYDDDLCADDIHSAFSSCLLEWDQSFIPDRIPCVALALKTSGSYSEERDAQDIVVLVIWNNGTARILSLEWFEGPIEDCISPEWYLRSTGLLPLAEAFLLVEEHSNQMPDWDNPLHSIFVKPGALGKYLINGKMCESPYRGWRNEWNYYEADAFQGDIDRIINQCDKLFY